MIIIENPAARANTGERAFMSHLKGSDGVALVNFVVGGGGPRKPGREVDVIVIEPRGIFVVEVKHTSARGELDSPANDVWSIGDIAHPFGSRDKTPSAQVDQATKILASALDTGRWPKTYLTPVVSIFGAVRIPEQVRWVGTVGVSTVEHFGQIVTQAKGKRLAARDVGPILRHLGVAKAHVPTVSTLIDAGFTDAPAHTATRAVPKPPPGRRPSPLAAEGGPPAGDGELASRPDSEVESTGATRPGLAGVLTRQVVTLRARIVTGACLVGAVLLGLWTLMTGAFVQVALDPQAGDEFFLYGAWTPTMHGGLTTLMPSGAVLGASLVGAFITGAGLIGLWLRHKVAPPTIVEVAAYLASIPGFLLTAPVLFRDLGWNGVIVAMFAYCVGWPLAAMLLIDAAKPIGRVARRVTFRLRTVGAAVRRYVAHLRQTYDF